MNLFDRVIHRTEAWLESLDRERDAAGRARAAVGPNDVLDVWMDRLEAERRDTVALLQQLRTLQHRRPLLFNARPGHLRMLKIPARRTAARKGA
jgi:hypothetical protein